MRNCVLVFLGGVPAALAATEPPLWPLAFGINATEGYTGKGRSTVSYFYDSRIPAEKWVRPATGLHAQDNVCQGVDVPCADLVVGGYRWIIHPTSSECCLLGTFAQGCGPLYRDWARKLNATYSGRSIVGGLEADQWDVQGFSTNRWYTPALPSPLAGLPVKLNQGGFVNDYVLSSFINASEHPFAADVFQVPAYCQPDRKCKSQIPCSLGDASTSSNGHSRSAGSSAAIGIRFQAGADTMFNV